MCFPLLPSTACTGRVHWPRCALLGTLGPVHTAGVSWSLIVDSLWAASGTLVLGSYLCAVVIPREEAYMHAHFGAAYAEYCSRVRRWLPSAQ